MFSRSLPCSPVGEMMSTLGLSAQYEWNLQTLPHVLDCGSQTCRAAVERSRVGLLTRSHNESNSTSAPSVPRPFIICEPDFNICAVVLISPTARWRLTLGWNTITVHHAIWIPHTVLPAATGITQTNHFHTQITQLPVVQTILVFALSSSSFPS